MDKTPVAPTGAPTSSRPDLWHDDWPRARTNLLRWWRGQGPALSIAAPRDQPLDDAGPPPCPETLRDRWIDPACRTDRAHHQMAHQLYIGERVPFVNTNVGAGDLAAMLGSEWRFAENTVWFTPCIDDPDSHPPLTLDRQSQAFLALHAMIDAMLEKARGRYYVGMPDLVENLDVLAALRDSQTLLMDLVERPDWVSRSIEQINTVFFEAFESFYRKIADPQGSHVFSAFGLWGPGRTAKVQCDASAMISPAMFQQFVVPALSAQCEWLDFAMYHLDGEDALCHLEALLSIEALHAIEWTPRFAYTGQGGGHPQWYDLYRRILAAGKSVQAVQVAFDEVTPLLDAVGGAGMSIFTSAPDEAAARRLLDSVEAYR